MAFSLDFRIHSEVGRIRQNNQDAAYASPHMLLVADGMGGAAAGDLASAVAATEASQSDRRLDDDHLLEHMAGIVQRANDRIADLIHADLEIDGMGTTFCGAAFSGTKLGIAHIGDSRGYLLRDGVLEQLTHDHSWVQSLIDEGKLTPDQAAAHPHRSLILKVLNGSEEAEPDFFDKDVEEGDVFLFCSDGLSGLMTEDELQELISLEDLDEAVTKLAALANDHGGHDNISLALARIVPQNDELDARQGVLAGSAVERKIPSVVRDDGPGYPTPDPIPQTPFDDSPEHGDAESARYAPKAARRSKRRGPWTIVIIIAALLVVGGAFLGIRAYAATRYFVAASDGRVAIYNGLPGSLLGYDLNRLVEQRDTRVEDLPVYYQQLVGNAVPAENLGAAHESADQLDVIAKRCVEVRRQRAEEEAAKTSASASPSPSPTEATPSTDSVPATASTPGATTRTYPTYLGPVTPTASEEADPEAC